jgi:hypothetical protein
VLPALVVWCGVLFSGRFGSGVQEVRVWSVGEGWNSGWGAGSEEWWW